MNNLLLPLAAFLLSQLTSFAQEDWVQQTSGTSNHLYSIYFIDSNFGWVVGESGTILHTSNAGEIWEPQESGVSVDLEDVFFWSVDNGWIVGDSGTILYTTDIGEQWTIQNTPVNTYLTMVQFISLDSGFVHGNQETSLSTTDGGNTWQGGAGDTLSGDYAGFFISDDLYNMVIILNYYYPIKYSVIYRSHDGGANWYTLPFPYSYLVRDLHGLRAHNFLFAAAERGNIYTSYFGDFWHIGLTFDTLHLNGVTSEAETWKLWAVGESGWIISSEDSGKTWTTSPDGTTADLYEVSFPSVGYGWAVGDSGTILHYWDPPTNVIDDKQYYTTSPESFELLTPYPNPFNPTTTIIYQIPEISFVTLKVYDVLGNEIATLVNEEKPAGEYNVEFSAIGGSVLGGSAITLTSGIYIYQLRAGDFVETKKMVLLK
jgi:photosystem II stability/assembly factor-like uncharacterized protein